MFTRNVAISIHTVSCIECMILKAQTHVVKPLYNPRDRVYLYSQIYLIRAFLGAYQDDAYLRNPLRDLRLDTVVPACPLITVSGR